MLRTALGRLCIELPSARAERDTLCDARSVDSSQFLARATRVCQTRAMQSWTQSGVVVPRTHTLPGVERRLLASNVQSHERNVLSYGLASYSESQMTLCFHRCLGTMYGTTRRLTLDLPG